MINYIQGQPLGRKFKALVCHDGVFSTLNQYSSEELYFPQHDVRFFLLPPPPLIYVPSLLPALTSYREKKKVRRNALVQPCRLRTLGPGAPHRQLGDAADDNPRRARLPSARERGPRRVQCPPGTRHPVKVLAFPGREPLVRLFLFIFSLAHGERVRKGGANMLHVHGYVGC